MTEGKKMWCEVCCCYILCPPGLSLGYILSQHAKWCSRPALPLRLLRIAGKDKPSITAVEND